MIRMMNCCFWQLLQSLICARSQGENKHQMSQRTVDICTLRSDIPTEKYRAMMLEALGCSGVNRTINEAYN